MEDKQQIIDDLISRGVENIISSREALEELLNSNKKLNCYLGIDPTATRIHLGHAFSLRKLQQMVDLGHNVTFLIGSYTALVGDTSDKNDERPMLTIDQINANFETYKQQASKFLDFDKVNLVYNGDWLSKLSFKDIIELASNFSVNDFISRELIRKRLDSGKRVSLPETLYPLMQGYDSYHLDTDIQFGGTDQTFNMQAGRTLNKRLRDKESHIVAVGFLPGTDGRKMSKSWGNAIWLDDSPSEVFGKIMRINDELIKQYFIFATNIDLQQVNDNIEQLQDSNPMELKKILARQVVKELHDQKASEEAEQHFIDTVQNKQAAENVEVIKVNQRINAQELLQIIKDNDLTTSKSEAQRLLNQGAIRINDKVIQASDEITIDGTVELRVGKRRYLKLES